MFYLPWPFIIVIICLIVMLQFVSWTWAFSAPCFVYCYRWWVHFISLSEIHIPLKQRNWMLWYHIKVTFTSNILALFIITVQLTDRPFIFLFCPTLKGDFKYLEEDWKAKINVNKCNLPNKARECNDFFLFLSIYVSSLSASVYLWSASKTTFFKLLLLLAFFSVMTRHFLDE